MDRPTADPPQTPPKLSHPTDAKDPNKSTPAAKGSSDNSEYALRSKQEDYAPFLEQDVAHEVIISVEDFLSWILGNGPAKAGEFQSILTNTKFQQLVRVYSETEFSRETELYHPFVTLANWCLGQMHTTGDVQFCRNDPTIVLDSDADRKPDVVNVAEAIIKKRDGVDNLSKDGPKDSPFYWRELLSFWEFKFEDIPEEKEKEPKEKKASSSKAKPKVASQQDQPQSGTIRVTRQTAKQKEKAPQSTSSSHHSTPVALMLSGDALEVVAPTKKPKKEVPPKLQCASYALELLSNGGLRSHVIAVLVSRNSLELLYYDRSIVVKSLPLRFTRAENRPTFLAILSGFGNLNRPRWGYPRLLTAPDVPQTLPAKGPLAEDFWRGMYKGHVLRLRDGWTLTLEDIIFRAHGIIGRGTVVVRATVTNCPRSYHLKGKIVVVKWSWVPKTRTNEADIVKNAWVRAEQDNRSDMLRHLPEIYHEQSFDELTPACQTLLLDKLPSGTYEARVLRVIVQAELKPITDLQDPSQLAKVFKEIFECYRWLYEKTETIHRDISVSNLMFHEIDGTVYGVLNDFDLALMNKEPPSTSKQRTGTKPYMAIDLLVDFPPRHLYRHDLESFLYVLVFLTCQIEGSPLARWKDLTMEELSDKKTVAISKNRFPPTKEHFQQFRPWIIGITRLFRVGFFDRTEHEVELAAGSAAVFHDETLGGEVTFAKFEAILNKPIISS
ncbi:hypothetical protein B0H14DRAFT_2437500 [Mycena olivaceomarginata]|nr:hypothetical protein B0H14DRAFT_2437500 [Mycena olivaceomarginata]